MPLHQREVLTACGHLYSRNLVQARRAAIKSELRILKAVKRFCRRKVKALNRFYIRKPNVVRYVRRTIQFKPQNILFYPDHPCGRRANYTIIRICHHLGYKMINDPEKKHHLGVNWKDATFREVDDRLQELIDQGQVINAGSLDISKEHVDQVVHEAFGYNAKIDPITYRGRIVEKSNLNGRHDGRIIEGPITHINKDKVYQKLIENIHDERLVVDMRVPVFKHIIPFVYLKYKPIETRFGLSAKAGLTQIENVFSKEEIAKCMSFCRKMGLDYGELDMGRDVHDGKLYIFDANNTPTVRYVGHSMREKSMIIRQLSEAFEEAFS